MEQHSQSRAVVELALLFWSCQDIPHAMECVAENAVFVRSLGPDMTPLGVETRGRDAIAAVYNSVLAEFGVISYVVEIVLVEGAMVRAQVQYEYRHRTSGELITGSMGLVFIVTAGLITRVEEHYDAPMAESMLRLFDPNSKTTGQ